MRRREAKDYIRTNRPMPSQLQVAAALKLLCLPNHGDQYDAGLITRAGRAMAVKYHPDRAKRNGMEIEVAVSRDRATRHR